MPVPSQQPDADRQGIASGHQPITVMLDFMHPVRPSWRLFTRRWQARLDEIGLAGARSRSDPNHRKRRLNGWQRLHRQGRLSLPHVPQSVSGHLDQDIRAPAQAKQGLHGKCVRSLIEEAASGDFIVGLRNWTPAFPDPRLNDENSRTAPARCQQVREPARRPTVRSWVCAGHRHRLLSQSSSASRRTAGACGFLNLTQSGDRPER
jgi:hypothetical protein